MAMMDYISGNGVFGVKGDFRDGPASWKDYVVLLCRIFLAAFFIYAAFQKAGKPLMFADEIRMYKVLGIGPLLYIMAIVLPWIEIICSISLLTGFFMRGSAFIFVVLNVVFIGVVIYRTFDIMNGEGTPFLDVYFDCGCGFGATYAWKKILEDAVFLLSALIIYFAPSYRFALGRRN
ncbi:MAG: DoxX family protein [Bacteroidales bacterium]|nr:DoxX family protein [Candidatus Latescibacterota bacterium]